MIITLGTTVIIFFNLLIMNEFLTARTLKPSFFVVCTLILGLFLENNPIIIPKVVIKKKL